jgi:chemotaxis protein MotB
VATEATPTDDEAAAAAGAETAAAQAVEEAAPVAPLAPPEPECPKCEECAECKAGAPAWMATFADMATLLMAFFVLILSFAEMNVPKFKQINGSLKNSFGVQRIIPVVESPKGTSIIAQSFSPAITEPTPLENVKQETTDDRKENPVLKTDDGPGSKGAKEAADKVAQALANEVASGQVEVTTENGKVVVIVNNTPGGGGAGAAGAQQGGASASGEQAGGAGAQGAAAGGASATGAQAGGASAAGAASGGSAAQNTQAGGSAAQGQSQGGAVSQATIDLYAKVAQAQAQVGTPVEVRDATASTKAGNDSGGGVGPASKAQTDNEFARIRKELAKEIEAGKAEVERDGAKIIIRLAEQGSFNSGSADLQPGFTAVLNSVGKSIASSTGRIFIEGHTDNVPVVFNDRFKSNWDLSGARSGAVADYLTARAGVPEGRMSVSGFADTRPIEGNDTAAGRARNRRIEVIIDGGG